MGWREVTIMLLEVPSGAWADVHGRRKAMVCSFSLYLVAFSMFALAESFWSLGLAMTFFAVGDVFRSGTHKAMIFQWLKQENRLQEKTQVYGYTRSWSRIGSAVAVAIAPLLVFAFGSYQAVFWASMLPAVGNILNFSTYPKYLDGGQALTAKTHSGIWHYFKQSVGMCFSRRPLRRLLIESATYEGLYRSLKDYLQPILQTMAVGLPIFLMWEDRRRTAVLIGAVYVVLHLSSAWASRNAHKLQNLAGGENGVSYWLWWCYVVLFSVLIPGLVFHWHLLAVCCFVGMAVAQNFWRPVLISRIGDYAPGEQSATVLSIESQTRGMATMTMAPLLGLAVDYWGFTPLGMFGLLVCLPVLLVFYRKKGTS